MTFKFTVKPKSSEFSFEAGSISEAVGMLESEKAAIGSFFALTFEGTELEPTTIAPADSSEPAAKKRGRRSNAEIAAANAPAPIQVPGPGPLAPVATGLVAPAFVAPGPGLVAPLPTNPTTGIPLHLDRAAAPTPPAPPPPPNLAPVPPIGSPLRDLFIADLRKRVATGWDAAKWLAEGGLIRSGSTFDEALTTIQFEPEDRIKPYATALGLSVG